MPPTAIKVENVSKRYIIGHKTGKDDGLRHVIERTLTRPVRWAQRGFKRDPVRREEFWALRDVSFEVAEGEVVGIIGRNGAGKSTLLKVLSRITEQTEGRIRLRGRLASLLEVGTGFHPELSGRENIYLNGAILGMGREEIKKKFDEIVDFAEVEKFLDTPVKRYSSGMYVRLAFAVAAHLEPEILVVDEVLAVGDMNFQRKCLGKMDDVAKEGRTVLFVSHNMSSVARLCTRAIMLRNGQLVENGEVDNVISTYLADGHRSAEIAADDRTDRLGNGRMRITHIQMVNAAGEVTTSPASGGDVKIQLFYRSEGDNPPAEVEAMLVCKYQDSLQFLLSSALAHGEPIPVHRQGVIEFVLPNLPLASGLFEVEAALISPGHKETFDGLSNVLTFDVVDGDFFGSGKVRPNEHWKHVGVLIPHDVVGLPGDGGPRGVHRHGSTFTQAVAGNG